MLPNFGAEMICYWLANSMPFTSICKIPRFEEAGIGNVGTSAQQFQ